jgi:hypothetical protein
MSVKVIPYEEVRDTLFGELGGVQILFIDKDKNTKFMLDIDQRNISTLLKETGYVLEHPDRGILEKKYVPNCIK